MAVDYGLLNQGQIPLSSKFQPVDTPAENQVAMANAQGKTQAVDEQKRQIDQATKDRTVLQNAMAGGADFHTPDGVNQALDSLKGQLSPDAYFRLTDHAAKTQLIYNQAKEHALKSTLDENKVHAQKMEDQMPMLGNLVKGYDEEVARSGGDPSSADAHLKDARVRMAQQMRQEGAPEDLVRHVESSPVEDLRSLFSNSPTYHAAMRDAVAEQQVTNGKSLAAYRQRNLDIQTGKGWKAYTGANGEVVRMNPASGEMVKKNVMTGDWEPVDRMPEGARPMGAKPDATAGTNREELKDTTISALNEYTAVNGKPPMMPSLGTGKAAQAAKTLILNHWADDLAARGISPTDAGAASLMRNASVAGLKTLTSQDAVIASGIKNSEAVFKRIVQHVAELGGADSPLVREVWSRGASALGDPSFVKLKQDIVDLQESAGRVYSGATGAGGTSKAFLEQGKKLADSNWSLEQVIAASKEFSKLAEARKKGVEDERAEMLNVMKDAGKSSAKPDRATRTDSTDTRIDPKVQAARDGDAVTLIKKEYDKAVSKLSTLTDPTERQRTMGDVSALRDELKRNKVDVPLPAKDASAGTSPAVAPGTREITVNGKKIKVTVSN